MWSCSVKEAAAICIYIDRHLYSIEKDLRHRSLMGRCASDSIDVGIDLWTCTYTTETSKERVGRSAAFDSELCSLFLSDGETIDRRKKERSEEDASKKEAMECAQPGKGERRNSTPRYVPRHPFVSIESCIHTLVCRPAKAIFFCCMRNMKQLRMTRASI